MNVIKYTYIKFTVSAIFSVLFSSVNYIHTASTPEHFPLFKTKTLHPLETTWKYFSQREPYGLGENV